LTITANISLHTRSSSIHLKLFFVSNSRNLFPHPSHRTIKIYTIVCLRGSKAFLIIYCKNFYESLFLHIIVLIPRFHKIFHSENAHL
jgi:hypothetical protein